MDVGDSTPPRRQRRRAIRPAGPVGTDGNPAPASNSVTPAPAKVDAAEPAPSTTATDSTGTDSASTAPDPASEDPAVDAPAVEDPAIGGSADASPGSSRTRLAAAVALLTVLVVGLVASGIFLLVQNRATDTADARGERFVQTARQTVLNLTTIHPDSAQADVDRLLAGASGDFKAEFEGREAPFVEVVQQARVDSTGDIVEAGIERQDDNSADVLVAARAMVKNSDAEEAQPRDFRLRVTVVDADGVMTASRVEFVP